VRSACRAIAVPILILIAYGVLTVGMTWPLARAPGRLVIPNPDMFGHVWAISWVIHQALDDPVRLYDANMYHPWSLSLAYTESLLPQALAASPMRLLGGGALLAHNLVLLLTFPLCGLGAYLLAYDLSRSHCGAFLAGLGYAFSAYRWEHMIHIGVLSMQWLPFALLLLRRAVRRPTFATVAGFVVVASFQALSSGYYAVLLAVALAVSLAFHLPSALRRGTLARVTLGLILFVVVVLPAGLPYRIIQERHHVSRGREECISWSARWRSYLDPGGYIGSGLPHARALRAWTREGESLYPGGALLALAAFGALSAWRRHAVRYAGLLLVTGVALSLGPEIGRGTWALPGPFELLRRIPPANIVRAPSRFGVLALLAIGLLAAVGWARLAKRMRAPRLAFALAATLIATEAFPVGLGSAWRTAAQPPPVADWLARAPRGPTLELPWDLSGLYLYWSTVHWQPMINGHGTIEPPGNLGLGLLGVRWPAPYASRILRRAGVRYVVVHLDSLTPGQRQRISSADPLPEGVALAVAIGPDRVYRIDPLLP
jgi:hypothetical protein